MNELALFAGAGGGILGGKLLGWTTVCAVERDAYAAQVLAQRQNDGILEPFPIWSDVTSFDGKPWAGIVDVVSGGFPCQDISAAGKGAGIDGERSGLWKEFARIISEVRPRYAFVENSAMLTTRGLGVVLADLAEMGFNAEWGVLSASDVGANHQRERIWILAEQRNFFSHTKHDRNGWREQLTQSSEKENATMAYSNSWMYRRRGTIKPCGKKRIRWIFVEKTEQATYNFWSKTFRRSNLRGKTKETNKWWETEPNVGRVADGVAYGMDRLKAIGNGQVSLCAATAFTLLRERLEK